MRFVSVLHGGQPRAGAIAGETVRLFAGVAGLAGYISLGPEARAAVRFDDEIALAGSTLLAPLRPHKNVVCVGRNYLDHAAEIARARGTEMRLPEVPTFFTKAPTAIAGPDETLELDPSVSSEYDWEGELAVVIGARCRDVPEDRAAEVVFGYTCLNDMTARDLQRDHMQWFKGKSLDHTCPIGPWIVDAAEAGDPQRFDIALRVNGVVKQHSNTANMIFGVHRIIASLSRGMTLEPGDVIATGTPEGVGMARNPPEFFADGDVVEVEIERIGVLRNRIALRSATRG